MTAKELMIAAGNRKCVTGAIPTGKPMPAAFICSMQFWRVAVRLPFMKIYKPKSKTKL